MPLDENMAATTLDSTATAPWIYTPFLGSGTLAVAREPERTRMAEEPSPLRSVDAGERQRRRGVYLLPNLITTAALFAGFYAIVAAANGDFVKAALAIYSAFILDTLDGRVARWTRSESEFGAEYDSLSDMVAFGVAPALVAFFWALSSLGQFGWVVAFVYMACAGLRLARFNTKGDNASFTGLASPSAAAIIANTVWIWSESAASATGLAAVGMALVTAATGLLMVSQFTYYSPKELDLKGRVPFLTLVAAVLVFAIVLSDPPRVLLACFTVYALSGPAMYLWRKYRGEGESAQEGNRPD